MTTCERLEELRDYAMGEGGRSTRDAMEKHVAACGDCAAELRSLQFTTAALRMAPDLEVPQRIAFVSDKVFEPSGAAKWFGGLWNSAARLGFASAVVLAAAFVIVAYRPGESGAGQQIVIPASVSKADVDRAVNEAVSKAVAQVRREDTAVLAASEEKHEQEHKALMVTMGQNMDYLQRRMNTGMMLASTDQERLGQEGLGEHAMKTLVLFTVAVLCFGATEPAISRKALAGVENAMNNKFREVTADPYDLLGPARGTYLDGYGALFTVEVQLVYVPPLTPFRGPFTPKEVAAVRERKIKKLPAMKEAMRGLMAGACNTLDAMPANQKISMETILWRYNWEDSRGLPERVLMTAEKGKLLEAAANHTDLASVITEQEQ